MFTGVIHHIGTISACEKSGDWKIAISHDMDDTNVRIGDSVACNGACMTVIDKKPGRFTIQVSAESLKRTAPRWDVKQSVHLERPLRMGDTLDGHMVTGHVDGLATIISILPVNDSHRVELEAPAELAKFIASKGSVTLDGVSLTVNEVAGNRFTVNLIPHTWQVTHFHERVPGDTLNLEIDLIARYTARLLGK